MEGKKSIERYALNTKSCTEPLRQPTKAKTPCKPPQETTRHHREERNQGQSAIKVAQEDSYTISYLKREVERAWKLIEAAEDKENKARKLFVDLKSENDHLQKLWSRAVD